jgi:hypothetical protein
MVGRGGGGSVLCVCSFAFTSALTAVAPPQVNPMFARVNQKGEILNPELAVSEVDTAGGAPGSFSLSLHISQHLIRLRTACH